MSATLDQDGLTVHPGDTLTGTYTGFTPTVCSFRVDGAIDADPDTFSASGGTWSAHIQSNAIAGSYVVSLDDGVTTAQAGTVTVAALALTYPPLVGTLHDGLRRGLLHGVLRR